MQPGVMLYFDVRPCLRRLTNEQKGRLFEAILDYGEEFVVPNFDDDVGLAIAWDFVQPRLDRDRQHYEGQILQRKYAVFVRECRKSGASVPSFEAWKDGIEDATEAEMNRESSPDIDRYPTTVTPAKSSTATPAKSNPEAEATRDFEKMRAALLEKWRSI